MVRRKPTTAALVNTTCPARINYRLRIQARMARWMAGAHGKTRAAGVPWQALFVNKFMSYAFAMELGVRVPQQYACLETLDAVPPRWPVHWKEFVIKPVSGDSALGVNIIRNGINTWTGKPVRGRDDLAQQSYYAGIRAANVPQAGRRGPIVVEELMRAPRGLPTAPDYKFFAFGGHVAAVWYVQGRHTDEECSAWYDATWTRRLDSMLTTPYSAQQPTASDDLRRPQTTTHVLTKHEDSLRPEGEPSPRGC